ncbi:DUF4280 domain-containing protein [Clostridium sp.]|uniref:DUF4280 domain-containing protein n=1 Tax=Clostridium sp. TaxID=1506 RepID=UPI002601FF7B|nr:DUF4280 domain-containing protein [Clostridium sp.]
MASEIYYIVRGATMTCNKGSIPTKINLPFSHGSYINGKPVMVKSDRVVGANISPFGECVCLGGPCCPKILSDWMRYKEDAIASGEEVLTQKSVLICASGGTIKFITDGQK